MVARKTPKAKDLKFDGQQGVLFLCVPSPQVLIRSMKYPYKVLDYFV